MRKFAAIVVAAAFVVSVAACSDIPSQVQGCQVAYKAGNASKSISASGAIGKDPKAKVPVPTIAGKQVEASTLKKGSGLLLGKGDVAEISLTLYTGDDGAEVDTSGYTKSKQLQMTVGTKSSVSTPIAKSLLCQRVGSRVVATMTAAQYFGSTAAATAANVDPKTVVISVADIDRGFRGLSDGILQPLQSGFPSVVTAPNGTPGLTLDLQEPPKTAQSEVVRRGSGAKLKAGENVLLQVQAIAWTNPAPTTTFDSTWTGDAPRVYTLKALTANAGGESLDASSVKALVGQSVGSQILVVVPPKFGYPSGKAPSGYPTGATLIFVYDILGIV